MSDENLFAPGEYRGEAYAHAPEPVAPPESEQEASSEPDNGSPRRRMAVALTIVAAMLVLVGVGFVFLSGDAGDSSPTPAPSASSTTPTQEPTPVAPTPLATPEVRTVEQTVVIEYPPAVAALTAADEARLSELVAELAPGEQVAVTAYAGFSASEQWAEFIGPERARVITDYLASLGVSEVLDIARGTSPAIDGAAGNVVAEEGIEHNRLAVVTAVTLGGETE